MRTDNHEEPPPATRCTSRTSAPATLTGTRATTSLHCECSEGVLHLRLETPGTRPNVMHPALIRDLMAELDAYRDRARVVLFYGTPVNGFLAGDDIRALGEVRELGEAIAFHNSWLQLIQHLQDYPAPIVNYVHRFSIGGGIALSCCADLIYAEPEATFGLPMIHLELSPVFIVPLLIGRIGRTRALEMSYFGRNYGAAEAERMGLVTLVSAEQGFAAVLQACRSLAEREPKALRDIRRRAAGVDLYRCQACDPDGPERAAQMLFLPRVQERLAGFVAGRRPGRERAPGGPDHA